MTPPPAPAAHTPGPWQMSGARVSSPTYKGHGVGPDGQDYVVIVPYTDRFHLECLANARLIASAPALLAALEGLVWAWVNPEDGSDFEPGEVPALDAARTAIRAARGEG